MPPGPPPGKQGAGGEASRQQELGFAPDQPHYGAAIAAQCDPDADFIAPPLHYLSDHAVQSEGRQQSGKETKSPASVAIRRSRKGDSCNRAGKMWNYRSMPGLISSFRFTVQRDGNPGAGVTFVLRVAGPPGIPPVDQIDRVWLARQPLHPEQPDSRCRKSFWPTQQRTSGLRGVPRHHDLRRGLGLGRSQ